MPKVDQQQLIERITKFVTAEFANSMQSVDGETGGLTPADVLSKRMEIAGVGEKVSIAFAVYLVKGADPNRPQIACKASVTLKASSPTPEYAELPWDTTEPASD